MDKITELIIKASEYEQSGNFDKMFITIREGLKLDNTNYELFYMLGFYYLHSNPDQAFLCFQNASFYCNDPNDKIEIDNTISSLIENYDISVKNTSIIIVSYNAQYMMQKNLESIRNTLPLGSYKIIAVDNNSTDGVTDYLRNQSDVALIEPGANIGFSAACNRAVEYMSFSNMNDYDVFLLNNDTRLASNSLFWLKMGLYSDNKVGATGSLSNYAGNKQQIDVEFQLPGDYLEYAKSLNIPQKQYLEERTRLSGFAMLIRHGLWQQIGGMDEIFTPGYFEDDDLSMKISQAGYRLYVCKNSFIYHAGSQSFSQRDDINTLLIEHHQLFIKKYGFDILAQAYPQNFYIPNIPYSSGESFNVLYVGCGLGADIMNIQNLWPNTNVVGIEPNDNMRSIVSSNETIFDSVKNLNQYITTPIFNVIVIGDSMLGKLKQEDSVLLAKMCLENSIVISSKSNTQGTEALDFSKVKLVIWDMDDTFWSGTLSEGPVTHIPRNVELIRQLNDAGIICSVSSKNNAEDVIRQLDTLGISDLFVFNNINWNNKGQQIQQKITDMNLRAENVLFIDDNALNLEEAKHYNPELMTAGPEILNSLCQYAYTIDKKDLGHKRLESYKVLERKRDERSEYVSNEDFLRESNIHVEISYDCTEEIDRILELITRTNQLNFTKVRDDKEKLASLLSDSEIRSGYIHVSDKYGDYGICGFYCFEKDSHALRHFLFSCRILGMGVEQYIYQLLECPDINIVEPVSGHIDYDTFPTWINVSSKSESSKTAETRSDNRIRILLKGPCDLSSLETYLIGGNITSEFNFVNDKDFITTGQNHSMHIWESAHLSNDEINAIINDVPFIIREDFDTELFSKEYDVICYSLLPDCHTGLYRNKEDGTYISFGSTNFDLTDPKYESGYIDGSIVNHFFPFTEDIIKKFRTGWEYVGTTDEADLIRNINFILDNVKGNPLIILLLGSEIEYDGENAEFANHADRHTKINKSIKSHFGDKSNVRLINFTDFIRSQDDYDDSINHFSRNVYYNVATELVRCINEKVNELARG